MIVTEEEAKTKLCPIRPMLRQYDPEDGGVFWGPQMCVASGCMKWRWGTYKSPLEIKARSSFNTNPVTPEGYCSA